MANLKNITELPVVESAEGLNLIVNDNGYAKQVAASAVGMQADWDVHDESSPAFIKNKPATAQADWCETDENSPSFIKNKPHRELMYEWNFEADPNPDNCVWEIEENVDEDISWLTTSSENIGWEIEVSQYGQYYDGDTDSDIVVPDVYSFCVTHDKNCCTGYQDHNRMEAWMGAYLADYLNGFSRQYDYVECYIYIYNKVHYNNGLYIPTEDNHGGHIYMDAQGGPLKSVKIYKVYR